MRRQYTAPRFHHTRGSDFLRGRTSALAEEAARLANDANLSDRGKLVAFTRFSAPTYKELRGLRATLYRKRDACVETARAATLKARGEPDALAREIGREFASEMRRDPNFKQRVIDRLTNAKDSSEETNRLRRYFLELDPMLSGIPEPALELIGFRLTPTLPDEVLEAEREFADLQAQLGDVQLAMESILRSSDRATLEELGVIGKPMLDWSPEERAAYIQKVGVEAYRADLEADMRLHAEPSAGLPEGQAPAGHADALEEEMARAEAEFARQQQAA